MKLNRKLLLLLLVVALVIFALFSIVAYKYDTSKYKKLSQEHLESVVNIQLHRLEQSLKMYKDQIKMVASRTKLRKRSLQLFKRSK